MVKVIAEIGINHNGDLDLCKKMIAAAKEAGADAVKFQKRDRHLRTRASKKHDASDPMG